jgi:hypothetical protein
MPNYLHPMQSDFKKARKALEAAVELIESDSDTISFNA